MSGIVKRKLHETWREAVANRIAEAAPNALAAGLAAYDAARAEGQGEAEAAFAVLSAHGLLWHVDAPGFAAAAPDPANPHSVPSA